MPNLELVAVHQVFPGNPPVSALRGVGLEIVQGEFVAIEGPSGSGKSTLLNDLALLHVPTRGDYFIDGESLSRATEHRRAAIRSRLFGFVFQSFHLLDGRPVIDSVELGLFYRGIPPRERRERALHALHEVGLDDKADQLARNLSGGERQRVAIARALAVEAPLIVADEPTGNLDSANGAAVVALLEKVSGHGRTVILVTHDPTIAAIARRRIVLRDGIIVSDRVTAAFSAVGDAQVPGQDASTMGGPDSAPGRDSTVRPMDLLCDGAASLRARPGKTAALVAAVAVAVALAVTTLGISETASAQVSARFNAVLNTEVTVTELPGSPPDPFVPSTPGAVDRALLGIAGVRTAGTLTKHGDHQVAISADDPVRETTVFGMAATLPAAARLKVDWADPADPTLTTGEVLVGQIAANELQLGPIDLRPTLTIDGRAFAVAGIVRTSNREIPLLSGVLLGFDDADRFGPATETKRLLVTMAGAAPSVARQAPLVLRPTDPTSLNIDAPIDPARLRSGIQADLRLTLLVLTVVAVLASAVGLTNAMVLSVMERAQEFGLRRAIGARPRHIVAEVVIESALIGVLGGICGLVLGLSSILGMTLANHWIPVFDLRLAPLAIVGGIAVGALGGVASAVRAARIQPADALRS